MWPQYLKEVDAITMGAGTRITEVDTILTSVHVQCKHFSSKYEVILVGAVLYRRL